MTLNGLYQSGTAPQAGQQIGGAVAGAMGGGQAPAAGGGFWGALRPQIQQLVAQQPPMNPWQQAQQKLGVNQQIPAGPNMGNEGQYPGVPIGAMPPSGGIIQRPAGPSPFLQGGTTRRGSQILDAQGNVIGHYDNNNQPVYHGGQGGGYQNPGPIDQGPIQDWLKQHRGEWGQGPQMPQGPVASTNMGMAPSYARLGNGGFNPNATWGDPGMVQKPDWITPGMPTFAAGVPGSMQQSLYGSGLLRPAMPSMNNQSGY